MQDKFSNLEDQTTQCKLISINSVMALVSLKFTEGYLAVGIDKRFDIYGRRCKEINFIVIKVMNR